MSQARIQLTSHIIAFKLIYLNQKCECGKTVPALARPGSREQSVEDRMAHCLPGDVWASRHNFSLWDQVVGETRWTGDPCCCKLQCCLGRRDGGLEHSLRQTVFKKQFLHKPAIVPLFLRAFCG